MAYLIQEFNRIFRSQGQHQALADHEDGSNWDESSVSFKDKFKIGFIEIVGYVGFTRIGRFKLLIILSQILAVLFLSVFYSFGGLLNPKILHLIIFNHLM